MRALLLFTTLFAGHASDEPRVVVRVLIGDAGDVEVGQLIRSLGDAAGISVGEPRRGVKLPIRGLAGSLTRTFLSETLGPEAPFEVTERELIIRIDPKTLDRTRFRARLEGLAENAAREASRRGAYGLRARSSYHPSDPSRPTVCLIHGINSTSNSFVHMVGPLEEAGFGVVVYDFPFNRDLDETIPTFARDWAGFRRSAGDTRRWVIVTHSMGALIARSYVEGKDYADDVADLILIAPPNHGSAVARAQTAFQLIQGARAIKDRQSLALSRLSDDLGAAAADLLPGSAFLKELNRRPRRAGVGYHILAGDNGFLSAEARARIDAQTALVARSSGLVGGLAKLATGDLAAQLDELTVGKGDGCVSVASSRLEGVADHQVIHANHVELIRGPLLYPDPGPVACMPWLLDRLKARAKPKDTPKAAEPMPRP